MRSLFLRTFLLFWITVLLAGIVTVVAISRQTGPAVAIRESLFTDVLPVEAREDADRYESSGIYDLDRRLTELESRYPLQTFFFDASGMELRGRAAPSRVRDMARLAMMQDLNYVILNVAGRRAVGPSGKTYALVFLQEPGPRYRVQTADTLKRIFGLELPIVVFIAAGLFCYFTARHVTRPVLGLRTAAAGITEGRLDTRVDPQWKRRKDEIGKLGRDFDTMAAQIESLVAAQKRLLGDVSHELRSPLSRLTVALSLLKTRPAEEAPELTERIGIEARRLDKLIGQLLTLARIDSGANTVMARFDLSGVVEEVARDAGFEARAQGREVAVTAPGACTMLGSEELIRSAVENVVRNAVRHTKEGTTVEVALEVRADAVTITVRDHGAGVPEEALAEIFVPFRRIAVEQAGNDGAGLGLAIAERAVRLHRGSIHASNAPDGGLIVTLKLPIDSSPDNRRLATKSP